MSVHTGVQSYQCTKQRPQSMPQLNSHSSIHACLGVLIRVLGHSPALVSSTTLLQQLSQNSRIGSRCGAKGAETAHPFLQPPTSTRNNNSSSGPEWCVSTPTVIRHAQLPRFNPRLPQRPMNAIRILTRPQPIPCAKHSPCIRHPSCSSSPRISEETLGAYAVDPISILPRPKPSPGSQHSPRIRHPGCSSSPRKVGQAGCAAQSASNKQHTPSPQSRNNTLSSSPKRCISTPAVVRHAQLPRLDPSLPQRTMDPIRILTRPRPIPRAQHSPCIRHPGCSSCPRIVEQAEGKVFCTVDDSPVFVAGHSIVKDTVMEGAGGGASADAVPAAQHSAAYVGVG